MRIIFAYVIFFLVVVSGWALNERPVIGIFSIPSDESDKDPNQYSYVPASYAKQMEGAGAMVVVVPWDADYEELDFFLNRIDGLLFTGGDSEIYLNSSSPGYTYNKLTDAASYLVSKILAMNKAGHTFPIMGTCQGFQLLNYIASKYYPVLSAVERDIGVERLLDITDKESQVYRNMSSELKNFLTTTNGPYYSHHWGVLPGTYQQNHELSGFFKVTGYSQDAIGQTYVASVEAFEYPIYGFQFHSEKHAFEWVSKADHSPMHIILGQHIGNVFVQQARLNPNTFPEEELLKYVIYNYTPENRMARPNSLFVQCYFFPRKPILASSKLMLGVRYIQEL